MYIMPSRYQQLVDAVQGYQQTGVPLIATHGTRLYPAGFADDSGIYYFIPKLVSWFGLTVERAIDVFFVGTAVFAIIVGLSGLFLLYQQRNQRLVALFVLLAASFIAFHNGDVYIISFFTAIAILPWVLLAFRVYENSASPYLILPASSFFIVLSNTIRNHSGTGILVFMVILWFFMKTRLKHKATILLLMVIAALLPHLFFSHIISVRNEFLKQQDSAIETSDGQHPFWHSVYIGLGFIDNPYVDTYLDEVAIEKVKSIDPSARFLSPEYSNILRHETFRIIREHPKFFVVNIAAKAGVVTLYFILFVNVGLFAAYFYRKPLSIDLAFWSGIFMNSLFGFAVVPYTNYLLGFIAFASLYGIVSINYGLNNKSFCDFTKCLFYDGRKQCAE